MRDELDLDACVGLRSMRPLAELHEVRCDRLERLPQTLAVPIQIVERQREQLEARIAVEPEAGFVHLHDAKRLSVANQVRPGGVREEHLVALVVRETPQVAFLVFRWMTALSSRHCSMHGDLLPDQRRAPDETTLTHVERFLQARIGDTR
jgi:hypothetical protein